MKLVCLDAHILIWGFKEESTPGQEDMVRKAKLFLKHIDDGGDKALIPSVVIGEFLMLIPPDLHNKVVDTFQKKFIIAPYDAVAASCLAKIWQGRKEAKANDFIGTRSELKIVAIAITHGASCIYSYDKELAKFAEGHIEVKEIPDISEQLPLSGI